MDNNETEQIGTDTLNAAVAYCKHLPGRMHPLRFGQKIPRLDEWQKLASRDPEQLSDWFLGQRENIGFLPDEGHFVLDLDRKKGKDGFAELAKLEAIFGKLPETLRASTPSKGEHRYFRGPSNLPYKTRANSAGLPGIDIRAGSPSNGYVAMPPSHTTEGPYAWLNWPDLNEAPIIAEAPPWLLDIACDVDPRVALQKTREKLQTIAEADLDDDPDQLTHLSEALEFLDADDYDRWISAGQALKSFGDDQAKQVWLDWSAKSKQFKRSEALKKWDGFAASRTNFRSIFSAAQAAGWQNPGRPKDKTADAIAEFNRTHAVVNAGGSVCILREGVSENGGSSISLMNKQSLATLYQNRSIPVRKRNADGEFVTKQAPLVDTWLRHADRRTHEGVTFAPDGKAPAGYYNLWRGFAVEPLQGSLHEAKLACRGFRHHIFANLCKGNAYHYKYLMAWLADMVQQPSRKKGVALVLRGKKGTGKSKFADILRRILGGHAFKASRSEHIIGRFTSHLADKLLLVAEESFFAGSKAEIGPLKDLITSDTFIAEQKHVPAFEVRSCHRVMMITNHDWAIPATEDERRFFVLDVGDERIQDSGYFAAIDKEMFERDGCRAFLRVLQAYSLEGFNLRKVPQTEALKKQKQLSLDPADQFIFDCIIEGEILGRAWALGSNSAEDPIRQVVYDAFVQSCRAVGARPVSSNRFGPRFEELTGAQTWQPAEDRRRRYHLPKVEDALDRCVEVLKIPHPYR